MTYRQVEKPIAPRPFARTPLAQTPPPGGRAADTARSAPADRWQVTQTQVTNLACYAARGCQSMGFAFLAAGLFCRGPSDPVRYLSLNVAGGLAGLSRHLQRDTPHVSRAAAAVIVGLCFAGMRGQHSAGLGELPRGLLALSAGFVGMMAMQSFSAGSTKSEAVAKPQGAPRRPRHRFRPKRR